jgi:hypothetical protein
MNMFNITCIASALALTPASIFAGRRAFDIKYVRFLMTVLFLLHLFLSGNAFGVPCEGQTVNIGETMKEVTAKCGEAALKEQRTITVEEITTEGTGTAATTTTTKTTTIIDEWTYDFGPEEVVQSYRFAKGKLKEISNKGFGAVHDNSIDTCRNGEALAVGDSTVDTYLKCGEPIARENRKNKFIESDDGVTKRRTTVPVVEWTYRYGRNAPGYTVTFENGVAVNIRTREFGK